MSFGIVGERFAEGDNEESADERAEAKADGARLIAERANAAKSQFLAHVSHELRTPLNAITGAVSLLLTTEMEPSQQEFAAVADRAASAMTDLLEEVLDLGKIEAGKLSVETIDFDLEKVLENVSNLISEKATAKHLELIFDFDPAVSTHPKGDPLRLGQILMQAKRSRSRTSYLGYLDGVGETTAKVIGSPAREHLRLASKPSKGSCLHNTLAVTLERSPRRPKRRRVHTSQKQIVRIGDDRASMKIEWHSQIQV